MKTSLKKLRGFGLQRHEGKEHRLQQSPAQLDELSHASQDMLEMRDCYESLLSAAAATANSAFEFSESLREMGDCLLEKTAMNDDEESAKVLLMLGKVHFELQMFVDRYRAHIFQTISAPSESLLNELCIVEEMKRQCDEKRNEYEDMIARHKEKGWLRSSKGETFSSHQLQAARDEYDEEANLFVFRMKSLKRGRSQCLLTQAARHHAAQLCFFRKALKSLEAIEPHVKLVTAQQHIDYQFTGLEDDDGDYGDNNADSDDDDDYESDSSDGYEVNDDGELSFADGQSDQGQDASQSRSSMELDKVDLTFPKVAVVNTAKENLYRNPAVYSFGFGRELKTSSKSAPLFAEKNFDPAERFKQMRHSSSRKLQTYVLPTPAEEKGTIYSGSVTQVPQSRTHLKQSTHNLWHSSPLEHKKVEEIFGNDKVSGPVLTQSVLKRSNYNTTSSRLTRPLTDGLASPQHTVSVNKKIKRQAFSGPLTGKSWPNNPSLSASGPILSTGNPQLFSGSLLRSPMPPPSSFQNFSASASSTFVSSPKISELHELPRPPSHLATKRPSNLIHHSAPLVPKGKELSATSKAVVSNAASMLPLPPQTVPRSYSIPSRGQGEMPVQASKPLEAPKNVKMTGDIASPPLIPITLSNS